MLYCPTCERLQPNHVESCPVCGACTLREPKEEDVVLLLETTELEAGQICAALSERQILFEKRDQGKDGAYLARSYQDPCSIFVNYEKLSAARSVLRGIGIEPFGDVDWDEDSQGEIPDEELEEKTPQSPAKRALIRVGMFVLVILVLWGVVALSDHVIALVKSWFTGG